MVSAPFTEIEMMVLTRVCYYDPPDDSLNNGNRTLTLAEYIELNEDFLKEETDINALESLKKKVSGDNADNYKIVKFENDNKGFGSGFSAIAIEGPEKGTITVAPRGTETFNIIESEDSRRDVHTDAQLGLKIEADQQIKMEQFMKDFKDADSIYLTGHSLGGNLAVHGAVTFSDSSKIKGVYTYNAPGQNAAYILFHADGIRQIAGKTVNYQNENDIVSDIDTTIGKIVVVKSNGTGDDHLLNTFSISDNGFDVSKSGKSPIHSVLNSGFIALTTVLSSSYFLPEVTSYLQRNINEKYVFPTLEKLGNWYLQNAADVKEWVSVKYDNAKGWAVETYNNISDWAANRYDDIKDFGKSIFGGISNTAKDIGKAIAGGVGSYFTSHTASEKTAHTGNGRHDRAVSIAATDDRIFIKPSGLIEEANKLKAYEQEYSDIMQRIMNIIITLKDSNIWNTSATTVFVENYMELKAGFDKFGMAMTDYASILEGVSTRMQNADNSLSGRFDSLSLQ